MRLRPNRPGRAVPAPVRAAVTGRPLAAVAADDGTWLVGTREELVAVGSDGDERLRLRWEQVQRADWDSETSTLRVEQVLDYGQPVASTSFRLDEPGLLLELVRERVTASVLLQRRVDVSGRRGFTVIGRRSPAGGGEVTWAHEFDPGVDPEDPSVRAAADAALRDARESLGL